MVYSSSPSASKAMVWCRMVMMEHCLNPTSSIIRAISRQSATVFFSRGDIGMITVIFILLRIFCVVIRIIISNVAKDLPMAQSAKHTVIHPDGDIPQDATTLVDLLEGQPSFARKLKQHQLALRRRPITTLQINIGKRCDLACSHCHVEAGPKRTENMTYDTAARLVDLLTKEENIKTVDITGGAPELNPNFRFLVSSARAAGKSVIDRCNLTVLFEKGQEDTAEFLAQHHVIVFASLPCYSAENVNKQRGGGVFGKSIDALQLLNQLGYGDPASSLELNLVYNPIGAHLPPSQTELEQEYHSRLLEDFGIRFNNLYTITNMPIKRYLHYLHREEKYHEYMQLLIDNFNIQATQSVMCLDLCSISWDGFIYDCDFNQMIDIPIGRQNLSIWDIDSFADLPDTIAIDNHCYGCTAGAGSSCGGALVE